MADSEKMYAVLCGAVDGVIEPLERIPLALPYARALRAALLQAESLYVEADVIELKSMRRKTAQVSDWPAPFRIFAIITYTSREPAGILSSSITRFSLSPRSADSSIPQDSCPIILRGGRLVTATRVLPTSSSAL